MKYQGFTVLFFLLVALLAAGCLDNIKGSGTGGIDETKAFTGGVLKYDPNAAEVNVIASPNAAVYVSGLEKSYTELSILKMLLVEIKYIKLI